MSISDSIKTALAGLSTIHKRAINSLKSIDPCYLLPELAKIAEISKIVLLDITKIENMQITKLSAITAEIEKSIDQQAEKITKTAPVPNVDIIFSSGSNNTAELAKLKIEIGKLEIEKEALDLELIKLQHSMIKENIRYNILKSTLEQMSLESVEKAANNVNFLQFENCIISSVKKSVEADLTYNKKEKKWKVKLQYPDQIDYFENPSKIFDSTISIVLNSINKTKRG